VNNIELTEIVPRVKLLKVPQRWSDFLTVEAGLRQGGTMLTLRRPSWKGVIGTPKSGR
jgi:hypothetical protein